MSSKPESMNLTKYPTITPQAGVVVVGDLHANPIKLIYSLVETGKLTNLDEAHYLELKTLYYDSYKLAQKCYQYLVECETLPTYLQKLETGYQCMLEEQAGGKKPDNFLLESYKERIDKAKADLEKASENLTEAKMQFLDHLRHHLPVFMANLRQCHSLAERIHLLRLEGDDTNDRGACDVFIQALLKILIEKNIDFDVLLSNHGIASLYGNPSEIYGLDGWKGQALSGVMMRLVIEEGQDILEAAGLTDFMEKIYFPRLKLGGYILHEGMMHIDYHAAVNEEDILFQARFLGLADEVPQDKIQRAKLIDAISDRVRDYVQDGRVAAIITEADYKHVNLSEDALRFMREHNPINVAIWNRFYNQLGSRTNDQGFVWRHGHDNEYTGGNPCIQCIDNHVGKELLTLDWGENPPYVVVQGQTALNPRPAFSNPPRMDLKKRLLRELTRALVFTNVDISQILELGNAIKLQNDLPAMKALLQGRAASAEPPTSDWCKYLLGMVEATEKLKANESQPKQQEEEPTMHNESDTQANLQRQGGSRKLANPQDCLSDHAYQGAEINFFSGNQRVLTLHGRTWNLMNRCRSKQVQGTYKNNPWNITETDDAYNQRKTAQLKRILELCQQGGDYFCLQEVDWFYNQDQKAAFIQQLDAIGWDFVMTRKVNNAKANIVLYNKNTLQFSKTSRGILPIASGLNTGFAVDFVHKQSQAPVTIVSLHLDYMHDYTHDIPKFQNTQVAANRFTVMAGDVNHQPNTQITGLCNDWNHVTNLGGDDDGNLQHLDEDPSRHQRAKCYDGFFANPTQNSVVQIIERESERFVPNTTKPGVYYLESVNTGRSHQSLPGKPWVRGAHKKKAAEEQRESVASPQGITEAPQPSVKTAFDLLVDLIRDDVWKSRHSQHAKYPNKVPIGLEKMRLALGTKASFTPSEKNALFQQFKKIAAGRDTWYSRFSFYQSRRHAKTKEFYNLLVASNCLNDLENKKPGLRGLMSAAASQVQASPK